MIKTKGGVFDMSKLIRYIIGFLFIVSITSIFAQQETQEQMQDVVYLKNGSIIRGNIIEQIPGDHLRIELVNGCEFVYKEDEIEKITKEPFKGLPCQETSSQSNRGYRTPRQPQYPPPYYDTYYGEGRKSSVLAFFLSFLIPGVGQYYNGQVGKGIIQELLVVGGVTTAILLGVDEEWHSDPYWGGGYYTQEITEWYYVGLGVSGVATLWSWIDAPISASNINKKLAQQQYGHMLEYHRENYAVGFDILPKKEGVGAELTIHF